MSTLVGAIEASEAARERTKVMLLTICGDWSVRDGFERLGMGRTQFQKLRRRMLEGAVRALEPGLAGRPRARVLSDDSAHEKRALEHTLRIARAQVDILDSGLGEVPRVRRALRRAAPLIGRMR
jgi:hypothetical protein